MWAEASAPSNIALIKYMGKSDPKVNKPTNSSFSFCLEKLRTFVRMRPIENGTHDIWKPYERKDLRPIQLSETGKNKFLTHLEMLKKEFKLSGYYEVYSANNFPSDCGLASSASSYAALTLAAHEAMLKFSDAPRMPYRPKELAKLSQRGSGSSCRSFFSPWSLWHSDGAESVQIPYQNLRHMVLLCDESVKPVTSSDAHLRVASSDLFKGRVERAEERLQKLISAFRNSNWKLSYELCWNEFWDMHVLFHTSSPSFIYMNATTMMCLTMLHNSWQAAGDGPLITMDAGSNIHLLFREDQLDLYQQYSQFFGQQLALWTDEGYRPRGV